MKYWRVLKKIFMEKLENRPFQDMALLASKSRFWRILPKTVSNLYAIIRLYFRLFLILLPIIVWPDSDFKIKFQYWVIGGSLRVQKGAKTGQNRSKTSYFVNICWVRNRIMYHFIRICVLREYLGQTKANYEYFWIFGPIWVNLSPKNGKNGPKCDQSVLNR